MIQREPASFDPRIADWFADDPIVAPGHILPAVLTAVPAIRQRRYWRLPRRRFMTTTHKLAIGAALVLTAMALGAVVVGRFPMKDSSDRNTFTSDRYGYSVRIPDGWTVKPAKATIEFEYRRAFPEEFDRDAMDIYGDGNADQMWLASTAIADGVDPEDWIYEHLPSRFLPEGGQCGAPAAQSWRLRVIAELQVLLRDICGYHDGVLVRGDRLYVMSAPSRDALATFLASIEFRPGG